MSRYQERRPPAIEVPCADTGAEVSPHPCGGSSGSGAAAGSTSSRGQLLRARTAPVMRSRSWNLEELRGRARQCLTPTSNSNDAYKQERLAPCDEDGGDVCAESTISSSSKKAQSRNSSFGMKGLLRQVSGTSFFSNDPFNDIADVPPNSSAERRPSQVFADVEGMKEKVRLTLHKPTYSVYDFYKQEGGCQAIAKSPRFENLSLFVVAMNAIWIAIETDHNDEDVLTQADVGFQVVQNLFCCFFVFEWIVRFVAFERKCAGFRDAWFALDSVLVLLMVLDTWIMSIVLVAGGGNFGLFTDSTILRMLRLLRLFRMARVARLLRATPELMTLIKAMAAALRSVFFTLCLLIAVMYVFAVGFTQIVADTPLGMKYFPTVSESMYTLLIHGTLLDNVSVFLEDVRSESAIATFLAFIFILLAAITVMNMLVGILCEVVGTVAVIEKEEMAVDLVRGKLEGIVRSMDTNKDSVISKAEFASLLENPAATKALHEVGVDPVGLVDNADIIFEDDIGDECDKKLTFTEFMEIVLELRGSRTASVKDIVNLRKYIRKSAQQTGEHMDRLESMLHKLVARSPSPRNRGRGDITKCGTWQPRSTPVSASSSNMLSMKMALETDVAEILKVSPPRLSASRHGMPHSEAETFRVQPDETAVANGDGGGSRSGGREVAEASMHGVQSEFDLIELRFKDAATSKVQSEEVASAGGSGRDSKSGDTVPPSTSSMRSEPGPVEQLSPWDVETCWVQSRSFQSEQASPKLIPRDTEAPLVQSGGVVATACGSGGSRSESKEAVEASACSVPSESDPIEPCLRDAEISRVQSGHGALAGSGGSGSSGDEGEAEPRKRIKSELAILELSPRCTETSRAKSGEVDAANSRGKGSGRRGGKDAVKLSTHGIQSELASIEFSPRDTETSYVQSGEVAAGGGGSSWDTEAAEPSARGVQSESDLIERSPAKVEAESPKSASHEDDALGSPRASMAEVRASSGSVMCTDSCADGNQRKTNTPSDMGDGATSS